MSHVGWDLKLDARDFIHTRCPDGAAGRPTLFFTPPPAPVIGPIGGLATIGTL
jgi:hypothetical protein